MWLDLRFRYFSRPIVVRIATEQPKYDGWQLAGKKMCGYEHFHKMNKWIWPTMKAWNGTSDDSHFDGEGFDILLVIFFCILLDFRYI